MHCVSAWASEYGLSLGQVACEAKSNEITAIPELLRLVDVKGAIVTIDAMGTQKSIAKAIVEAGGDYVLTLKANKKTLRKAVEDHILGHWDDDFAGFAVGRAQGEETGHGRVDSRTYVQLEVPADLPGAAGWPGLRSIGVAVGVSIRDGKPVDETRYFLSSLPVEPDAASFARAVRSHWGVENGCHWSLDVTYREDESRVRERVLCADLAWLNRLSLSLLKQMEGRLSVAMRRRSCGWSDEYLMKVVNGSTN